MDVNWAFFFLFVFVVGVVGVFFSLPEVTFRLWCEAQCSDVCDDMASSRLDIHRTDKQREEVLVPFLKSPR